MAPTLGRDLAGTGPAGRAGSLTLSGDPPSSRRCDDRRGGADWSSAARPGARVGHRRHAPRHPRPGGRQEVPHGRQPLSCVGPAAACPHGRRAGDRRGPRCPAAPAGARARRRRRGAALGGHLGTRRRRLPVHRHRRVLQCRLRPAERPDRPRDRTRTGCRCPRRWAPRASRSPAPMPARTSSSASARPATSRATWPAWSARSSPTWGWTPRRPTRCCSRAAPRPDRPASRTSGRSRPAGRAPSS